MIQEKEIPGVRFIRNWISIGVEHFTAMRYVIGPACWAFRLLFRTSPAR